MDGYVDKLKIKWFWRTGTDGVMLPYTVDTIKIIPPSKWSPKHIDLTLKYCLLLSDSNIDSTSESISFYTKDFFTEKDADNLANSQGYFTQNDGEIDDEDDEKPIKEKKVPSKIKGLNLRQILFNKGVFYHTDVLQDKYLAQFELWKKTQLNSIGKQFICNSQGYSVSTKNSYWDRSRSIYFIEDGTNQKLVVDEFILKNKDAGIPITVSTSKYGLSYLPYHLYVNLYYITKHSYCRVHVDNLIPYKYNKTLLDKLVISEDKKRLISALIDGETSTKGKDLIAGKSGGIVILGWGPPGNGKTLTGEIYSEYVEKPLYQIQSSQLGLSVDDVEENLKSALRRADRWDCILMIDEADTYIYKRGKDIQQNCIVGTILREMEYYNGILFLTTNRADIIDEAVMSRVTVSIEYNNPDEKSLVKIWETLSASYKLNLSKENMALIAKKYPMSGRDVRNCLKLLNRYYQPTDEITPASIEFMKEFLPSINTDEIN